LRRRSNAKDTQTDLYRKQKETYAHGKRDVCKNAKNIYIESKRDTKRRPKYIKSDLPKRQMPKAKKT